MLDVLVVDVASLAGYERLLATCLLDTIDEMQRLDLNPEGEVLTAQLLLQVAPEQQA